MGFCKPEQVHVTSTHLFYLLFQLKLALFKNEEHPFRKAKLPEQQKYN